MSRMTQFFQHQAESPSLIIKGVNWLAAVLGVGTFLHLVNLLVGALSGIWLAVQLYGYIRYELPMKREKLRRLKAGLIVNSTQPGDLR
jgi:hypothetical protein